MGSWEEDDEFVPDQVTKYYFVDENEDPISFAALPFRWSDGQTTPGGDEKVVLHGIAESGQHKVYKPVVAWKLELSEKKPITSVLTKEDKWIELLKPRPSYEEMIRSAMIMVQALHFAYKDPDASQKDLWEHLRKTFSMYEPEPSDDDLREHRPLICELIKRHQVLAKAKVGQLLVEGAPKKRKSSSEGLLATSAKSKFIVDDADDIDDDNKDEDNDLGKGNGDSDESEDENDQFDFVCAFCDNGGEILCCEGSCLRSFHATVASGSESDCQSLEMSDAEVKATPTYFCPNCKHKQHQCFACGALGSSDKLSNPEVFRCSNATCGRFYHPECAAEVLYPGNETRVQQCKEKIAAGTSFACPLHMCFVCRQWEDTGINNKELQFAVCRRCPKAYHRKCLPRKIAFDDNEEENILQRAWEDLIPNRILIYCLKHKIDEDLGTPIRNHIKFPESSVKRKLHQVSHERINDKIISKKRKVCSNDISQEKLTMKKPQKQEAADSSVKGTTTLSSTSGKKPPGSGVFFATKPNTSVVTDQSKQSDSATGKSLEQASIKKKLVENSKAATAKMTEASDTQFLVDSKVEKRVTTLIEKCKYSLTLDDIVQKHKVSSLYQYSKLVDRSITHGKVEVSIEAVKAALKMLEEGGTIEDAKAVCEPQILNQIIKWKARLRVYLAPFIHGVRYSSFGRHFTKVTKLKEIVEMLHWYIKSGDMIVDFCCGANDFSRLLKDKLDESGKLCSFKNYDLIRPKNDFEFEKRDWMTVKRDELPTGSRLVMGLNPPFGVKAALANKFLDKALEFRPKLLVLIVPPETERLDHKKHPYDIIWEDAEKFHGKAFYLPGSVDVDDSDLGQWNTKAPVLYLWSRPDWTLKHQSVAVKQGHVKGTIETGNSEEENGLDTDGQGEKSNTVFEVEKYRTNLNESWRDEKSTELEKVMTFPSMLKSSNRSEQDDMIKNQAVNSSSNVSNQRIESENVVGRINQVPGKHVRGKTEKHMEKFGSQQARLSSGSMQSRSMSKERPSEAFKFPRVNGFEVTESKSISRAHRSISKERPYEAFKSPRTDSYEAESLSITKERTSEAFKSPKLDRCEGTSSMSISGEEPFEDLMSPGIDGDHNIRESQVIGKTGFTDTEARFRGPQNHAINDELEDIERRYSRINGNMFPTGTSDFQMLSHGYMNSREQGYTHHIFSDRFPSFLRENSDEAFQTGTLPRAPVNMLGERYGRPDFDARQQVKMYGQRNPDDFTPQGGAYALDQDRSRVGTLGSYSSTASGSSAPGSSNNQSTASVIHRYAPRLDELNRGRENVYTPDDPERGNPVFGSMTHLGTRSGFQQDPINYPYPYSRRNPSGGWINE